MPRTFKLASLGALALLASACTIVRVDGPARVTSTHFGVLRIQPEPGAGMVAYRTRGFGLVPGPEGVTLGYSKAEVALAYDPLRCQSIVFQWPGSGEGLSLLLREIKDTANICMTGGKSHE
ncbi:MAG: hypothetical protein ACXW27_16010 [Allosphingosinicella sp.]